jgi:hypothetical protein
MNVSFYTALVSSVAASNMTGSDTSMIKIAYGFGFDKMHVSFYTTLDSSAIASNITRSNISFAENFPYKFGFGKNHMSF